MLTRQFDIPLTKFVMARSTSRRFCSTLMTVACDTVAAVSHAVPAVCACTMLYHICTIFNAHPACYVSHASFLQANMHLLPMHKPYYAIMLKQIHLEVLHQHFSAIPSHVSYFCSSGRSSRRHPPRLLIAPGNVHLPAQASVVEKDPGLDSAHLLCHCHDFGGCGCHSWNRAGCK